MVKTKKNLNRLMGLFIIIIMASSVLGIMAFSGESEQELPDNAIQISGYTFYEMTDGTFGTELEKFLTPAGKKLPVLFRLDPRDAENISIDAEAVNSILSSSKIYLAYNPNSDNVSKIVLSAVQISRLIPVVRNFKPVPAYTEDTDPIDINVPLKTCSDAGEGVSVIIFETAEKTQIIKDNDCVRIQGTDADELILAADKLGMWLVKVEV